MKILIIFTLSVLLSFSSKAESEPIKIYTQGVCSISKQYGNCMRNAWLKIKINSPTLRDISIESITNWFADVAQCLNDADDRFSEIIDIKDLSEYDKAQLSIKKSEYKVIHEKYSAGLKCEDSPSFDSFSECHDRVIKDYLEAVEDKFCSNQQITN